MRFLRLVVVVVVLLIPLTGAWLASSLAAASGSPPWLALAAAALAFPVLPVTWDLVARRRRRAAADTRSFLRDIDRPRVEVGWVDRIALRTLALNALFVGGLLLFAPRAVGVAVAARGDWFLDGVHAPWVDRARSATLAVADRVGGTLAEATEDNPYAELGPATTEAAPAVVARHHVDVALTVPDGARARVEGLFPPEDLAGTVVRSLPVGAGAMRVDFADGLRLVCPFTVVDPGGAATSALALAQRDGSWSLADPAAPSAPCLQLRPADPSWRPDLHLLDRRTSNAVDLAKRYAPPDVFADDAELEEWLRAKGWLPADERVVWGRTERGERAQAYFVRKEPAVGAAEVTAVQVREPFLRVTLSPAGGTALCEATRASPWARVALVVDGAVVGVAPEDTKEQCTGAVSVPVADLDASVAVPAPAATASPWPMSDAPDPLVAQLPAEDADSVADIGQWAASVAPDPFARAKLVHDVVVSRLEYDRASIGDHRAAQDADTVLRTGKAVCAGYANLMVAIGRAAGLRVVYLTGDSRGSAPGSGGYHAWNAVELGGAWYLVDATWDDAPYEASYLFTPPEVFAVTHFPDDPAWQLLPTPIGRGDFERQPVLRPSFYAAGLHLVSPDRSQVAVPGDLEIVVDNPSGVALRAQLADGTPCAVDAGTVARCALPSGKSVVHLFREGSAPYLGTIEATRP